MKCEERWRLLMATMPRARELHRAMRDLSQTPKNDADYDLKSTERAAALSRLKDALKQLHEHIAEHGCREKRSN